MDAARRLIHHIHTYQNFKKRYIMKETSDPVSTQKLDILWEPAETGVRILRVFGEQPVLILPEQIGGRAVTEIGAYCFSLSEPKLPETYFHCYTEAGGEADPSDTAGTDTEPIIARHGEPSPAGFAHLTALCGSSLKEIRLPDGVTTLHNAAFYNCRELQSLSVGGCIHSIGSDEFMNCRHLRRLVLRRTDTEAAGLSLLLERFVDDLLVQFAPEQDAGAGALFFPEYYEWLDEISPAHIFSRSIHGEGFRMRKCVENNRVNYEKYDQCFENACKVESDETLCRISLTRLRYPAGLKDPAREQYESALSRRLPTAVAMAIRKKDMELLLFLCRYFASDDYNLAINACIKADWGEGSARLMEEKHRSGSFADKSFTFDDFDDF